MFFSIDNKFIYFILVVLVLTSMTSIITNPQEVLNLLFMLPGVIIAITFHEYAHAFAAYHLGDNTARNQGRLNLNPISHLDTVGFFLLIFAHFGWGKPVPINPRNFDKTTMAKGEIIVSLAGPLMNFILAIIFTIIYAVILRFFPLFIVTNVGVIIEILIVNIIFTNIGLGVFNLIPLPPLDGSKIFMNILPYNARNWILENERIFYFIFLGLWITRLAVLITNPVINIVKTGIFWPIFKIFGLW